MLIIQATYGLIFLWEKGLPKALWILLDARQDASGKWLPPKLVATELVSSDALQNFRAF